MKISNHSTEFSNCINAKSKSKVVGDVGSDSGNDVKFCQLQASIGPVQVNTNQHLLNTCQNTCQTLAKYLSYFQELIFVLIREIKFGWFVFEIFLAMYGSYPAVVNTTNSMLYDCFVMKFVMKCIIRFAIRVVVKFIIKLHCPGYWTMVYLFKLYFLHTVSTLSEYFWEVKLNFPNYSNMDEY